MTAPAQLTFQGTADKLHLPVPSTLLAPTVSELALAMRSPVLKFIHATLLLFAMHSAIAEVFVSKTASNVIQKSDVVGFSKALPYSIGNANPGDSFDVVVALDNDVFRDISAYVVDEINLNLLRQQLPFKYTGVQKGLSPIRFSAKAESYGPHYLVLDNRYAKVINKKVRFGVTAHTSMSSEQVTQIKRGMEKLYLSLKSQFVFTDFNIYIKPCKQANAFSNPDITMCSELLSDLAQKKRNGAVVAIFLHEVGHTLLNFWGLPGFDNEDTADEFAASLLVRSEGGKKALYEIMAWFSESNARAEAQNMIDIGDRHSLSIQRIRNLERILANPEPVARRWNQLLYEHYTDQALQKTASSPGQFDDTSLASKIIAARTRGVR